MDTKNNNNPSDKDEKKGAEADLFVWRTPAPFEMCAAEHLLLA